MWQQAAEPIPTFMPRNRPIDPHQLPPIRNAVAQIELTSARIKVVSWVFAVGLVLILLGQFKPVGEYFRSAFPMIFTVIGLALVVLSIAYVCQVRPTMNKRTERYLAFFFGVMFLVAILVLAIFFPNPTPFQYTVFRVVLSLAAAGFATMIPGFLEVRLGNWLRATGAIAIFVIVYLVNPVALLGTATH